MIIKVTKVLSPEVSIFGSPAPTYKSEDGTMYISLSSSTLDALRINLHKHLETLHVVDIEGRDMLRTYNKERHSLTHGYSITELCNTLHTLGAKTQIEVANFLREVTK